MLTSQRLIYRSSRSLVFHDLSISFHLVDLVSVKKVKRIAWTPGKGTSLEVATSRDSFTFSTLLHRDSVFDALVEAGAKLGLTWNLGD